MELTQERLKGVLNYDPETGEFTWNEGHKFKQYIGRIAGGVCTRGYLKIRVDGRKYFAHRLAWLYSYGALPTNAIDHIDGVPWNNRIANLRLDEGGFNLQNRKAAGKNSSSGFLGVSPRKSARGTRWCAAITLKGCIHHLGTFATPESAHAAYLAAKRQIHQFCTI